MAMLNVIFFQNNFIPKNFLQKNYFIKIFLIIFFVFFIFDAFSLDTRYANRDIEDILNTEKEKKQSTQNKEFFTNQNNFIFCTGDSLVAKTNNQAVSLMEKNEYQNAALLLEKSLPHAPIFFAFHYNLGICYIHLQNFKKAKLELTRAKNIVPEYYASYFQFGILYIYLRDYKKAINYFSQAYSKDYRQIECLTQIGDIHYQQKRIKNAEKYYKLALKHDRQYSNAKLGIAKINFYRKEYYQALLILRNLKLSKNYNKSYHFYYAECSYKLKDYQTAFEQYSKLLDFRNDRFFLTTSVSLIEHKKELAERFLLN